MATGNSVTKREDVPETLFEVEEEPSTKKRSLSRPPPEDASPEFKNLVESMNKRQERRTKRRTVGASTFNRARQEVSEMIESGDWEECKARHLVALYDLMHLKCYGVEAIELTSEERYKAAFMAANLVKSEFGGDYISAVAFMRWAWTREIKREKWRRETGSDGGRLLHHWLFNRGRTLTDYRLWLARNAHKT